jgi:hypothetical protein
MIEKTYHRKGNQTRIFVLLSIFLVPSSIIWLLFFNLQKWNQVNESVGCKQKVALKLIDNTTQIIQNTSNQSTCFQFYAKAGQTLNLDTSITISIIDPNKKTLTIQGKSRNILNNTGNYLLHLNMKEKNAPFSVQMILENKVTKKNINNKQELSNVTQAYVRPNNTEALQQLAYNFVTPPKFNSNKNLQQIVNNAVNMAQLKGLPIEKLSISLVDLNAAECCAYASYLDNETRYPASIVKLFWMVELYSQYQAEIVAQEAVLKEDMYKMIQDSNNESASRILDVISQTKSGGVLPKDKLDTWLAHRYSVNNFFEKAGYQKINISQKPFPIPYLNLNRPEGRDLQMRQIYGNTDKPVRNYLTTYSVARLLFEIYTERAATERHSLEMKTLLKRDLHPTAWKQKPYNSIAGFLGESLPINTIFYSKMGWTFSNRNDAAIIVTPDGKHKYILVVFGDDPMFYKDKNLFPEISRAIYNQLTK